MSNIYIKNGSVILNDRIVDGAAVEITGSKITAVDKNLPRNDEIAVIDAKGSFVSPGFIDCHIHGSPEDIFSNEAKHGTTAFVIAESCAPLEVIYKRGEKIKEFIRSNPLGANVLGLRLEGPYISKEKAGAQDPAYIKAPDLKELSGIVKKLSPILKIMTVAPELGGIQPVIRLLRKNNIIVSMGHSGATYEEAIDGLDAGITHATHTFNAMSGLDRRDPGVVGATLLDDRVTTEIILDLIHVHKALFGLLMKLKKKDKVIVVTDSITSELIHSRSRRLNVGYNVDKSGGAYRFEDGRLAGSSLTMIQALKNAVKDCGVPLLDAVKFITTNPAKLLGIEGSKGSIATGKDADVVVFDKEFDVKATIIRGKIVYNEAKTCVG